MSFNARLIVRAAYQRFSAAVSYAFLRSSLGYSRVKVGVKYALLRTTAEIGEFVKFVGFRNAAGAFDTLFRNFTKAVREEAKATDTAQKALTRSREDIASPTDVIGKQAGKALADQAQTTDTSLRQVSKVQADVASATEVHVKDFTRNIAEVAPTSDVLTKALTFIRGLADTAIGADTAGKRLERQRSEAVGAFDIHIVEQSKVLSEVSSATDTQDKRLERNLADTPSAFDVLSRLVSFQRSYADDALGNDVAGKSVEKQLNEPTSALDELVISRAKVLSDFAYATDDVNGASADDDQVMQFIRTRNDPVNTDDIIVIASSFVRTYSEQAGTSEVAAKSFTKASVEQIAAMDSGFIRNQGYCEIDYFAEDYVGTAQTF